MNTEMKTNHETDEHETYTDTESKTETDNET